MTDIWADLPSLESLADTLRAQNPPSIRERNRIHVRLKDIERRIDRRVRSRDIYIQLHNPSVQQRRAQKRVIVSHVTLPTATNNNNNTPRSNQFLRDLILPQPVTSNAQQSNDVCSCGTQMQRHMTMSYVVCPKCYCKRVEIDMCARDSSVTIFSSTRSKEARKSCQKKTASHYGTFLNTNTIANKDRKDRRDVDPRRLHELCRFAYVEGARKPDDITHQLLNRAQKHTGKVEYSMTRTYVSMLRNDSIFIPEDIKAALVKLYKFMQPVYIQCMLDGEDAKTNMPKFTFVSRIFCRLLGLDIFVPLFNNFTMSNIMVRRTAFMRKVFRQLGWEWSDAISDVPNEELDAYEQKHLDC